MKELSIPIVNIVATMRCNLRCKLCSTLAPYYHKPYHPTLDMLKKQASRFFAVIKSVERFIVSGGEVMLRPDLREWIEYITNYASQIGKLELNTNGTILPSEILIVALSKYPGKIRIMIDNYGLDKSKNVDKAADMFRSIQNAEVDYRNQYYGNAYFNGWLDYGIYNLAEIKRKSHQEAIKTWTTCASHRMRYFTVMQDGKLHHCGRHIWLCTNGIISGDSDETVDFFDIAKTDDDIRTDVASLYERIAFSSCAYCNGLQENAIRYAPAEQMTHGQQKEIWRKNNEYIASKARVW